MQPSFSLGLCALSAALSLIPLVTSLEAVPHGQPRRYNLALTWETNAPDGFEREMFMVNGQFPGPLLEFNENDEVEIFVENKSPYPTSIHYHGIEMLGTPWSDGVPGITQVPIQPGCAFTYRWTASQHGTYFYHSHFDSQFNDGLYGPIVIHPAPNTQKPYELLTSDPLELQAIEAAEAERTPLVIGDWRHMTSEAELTVSQQSHLEVTCFDSILVNGKGNVNCLAPAQQQPLITPGQRQILGNFSLTSKSCIPPKILGALNDAFEPIKADISVIPPNLFDDCVPTTTAGEVIHVTKREHDTLSPGKWAVFDIISALSSETVMVSIDEIRAHVVAIDGHYIQPVPADALLLVNGQRYTILAQFLNPKKYTLRVSTVSDPQILYGSAVIDYTAHGTPQSQEPSIPSINERGANLTAEVITYDGMQSTLYPPNFNTPSPTVDATYKVLMGYGPSLSEFIFNGTVRIPDDDSSKISPLLFAPEPGLHDNHTITVPSTCSWVDYIIQVKPGQPPHPIHIHGRHFYVLGSGQGAFEWDTVAQAVESGQLPEGTLNLVNPQLRDTYVTPASGPRAPSWLVLRRPSDNEGTWLIHCHIQSHLQGGMSMVIQDGTDGGFPVPEEYRNYECAAQ